MSESRIERIEQRLAARDANREILESVRRFDEAVLRNRGIPLPSEDFMADVDVIATVDLWHSHPDGSRAGLVLNDGTVKTWPEVQGK